MRMLSLLVVGCTTTPTAGFINQLELGLACASGSNPTQIGQAAFLDADSTMRLQLYPEPYQPDNWGVLFVGSRLDRVFSDDDACDDVSTAGFLEQHIEMAYSITQGSLSWFDDGNVRRIQMLDVVFTGAPEFAEFNSAFTEDDALNAADIEVGDVELPGVSISPRLLPLQ